VQLHDLHKDAVVVRQDCLEGIDIDELVAAPIAYQDGLNDNWSVRPAETRHL
jgi:hypothetical protein